MVDGAAVAAASVTPSRVQVLGAPIGEFFFSVFDASAGKNEGKKETEKKSLLFPALLASRVSSRLPLSLAHFSAINQPP